MSARYNNHPKAPLYETVQRDWSSVFVHSVAALALAGSTFLAFNHENSLAEVAGQEIVAHPQPAESSPGAAVVV